jgi:hypothetical protein
VGLASAVIRKVIEEIGKKNHQCPLRRIEEITDEMNFTKKKRLHWRDSMHARWFDNNL